ncbi:hypothetical protein Hanom_Chr16g01453041 [Helianthus anomalus]
MEWERAKEFIPARSPWDRLFELSHMLSYTEIIFEVLSLFKFRPCRADQLVDPAHPFPRGFFSPDRPGACNVAFRMCDPMRFKPGG